MLETPIDLSLKFLSLFGSRELYLHCFLSSRHRQIIKQGLLAHTLKPGNCPLGFAGSHIPPIPTEPFSLFSFFFCFCFFFNHLFIWLCQLLVVASGTLTCGRWDLVPGPGRNPDPCTGSAESQPLDLQGSLPFSLLLECPPGFPCIFTQAGKLPLLNHAVPCVSR